MIDRAIKFRCRAGTRRLARLIVGCGIGGCSMETAGGRDRWMGPVDGSARRMGLLLGGWVRPEPERRHTASRGAVRPQLLVMSRLEPPSDGPLTPPCLRIRILTSLSAITRRRSIEDDSESSAILFIPKEISWISTA
ncbi:hypothetical protein KPH14_010115 [Odynerus spinipes]|uniref:Uncharacterized protein n=1 Tax=Odynerus spinipes TaxID=1348599 RepID=A0AAD9VST3_9HYME|nr:hypothetical protein KPH14_010115 [Odynerus spinipes]